MVGVSSVDSTWEATAVAAQPSPHYKQGAQYTAKPHYALCWRWVCARKGTNISGLHQGFKKIIFPNILLQLFKHIFGLPVIDLPLNKYDCERKEVCLLEPPQPAVMYFFQAGVNLSMEKAKFWPVLTNFDYYVGNFLTL